MACLTTSRNLDILPFRDLHEPSMGCWIKIDRQSREFGACPGSCHRFCVTEPKTACKVFAEGGFVDTQ